MKSEQEGRDDMEEVGFSDLKKRKSRHEVLLTAESSWLKKLAEKENSSAAK